MDRKGKKGKKCLRFIVDGLAETFFTFFCKYVCMARLVFDNPSEKRKSFVIENFGILSLT